GSEKRGRHTHTDRDSRAAKVMARRAPALLLLAAACLLYGALNAFVAAGTQVPRAPAVSMNFFQKEEPKPTEPPPESGPSFGDGPIFAIGAVLILLPFLIAGPAPENANETLVRQESERASSPF
ncbi:unnamed protein product, partial [Effrenium voratum]